MNVAIFTDFYLPSLGGVQTSITNQKRALERAGHSVTIFAPCYDGQTAYEEEDGVIRLPASRLIKLDGHRAFLRLWERRRVEAILRRKQVDVVHCQTEFTVAHMGLKAAHNLKLPAFYTTHTLLWRQIYTLNKAPRTSTLFVMLSYMAYWGTKLPRINRLPDERWAEYQWRRLMLFTAQRADAVVSPSTHLRQKYHDWGYRGALYVIPNFADIAATPLKALPQKPVLLWVGRLSPEKRPLEFLEAVRLAQSAAPGRFTTVICGSGRLETACRSAAGALSDIRFTKASNGEMARLYDESSALVLSSYDFDNQPMVIAEALTRHRGIVYCDPQLTPDGLADGAGMLSGPTSEEMAATICDIIENPAKLDMMSKKSVSAATLFSEQHYLDAIQSVYSSHAENRRSTANL